MGGSNVGVSVSSFVSTRASGTRIRQSADPIRMRREQSWHHCRVVGAAVYLADDVDFLAGVSQRRVEQAGRGPSQLWTGT